MEIDVITFGASPASRLFTDMVSCRIFFRADLPGGDSAVRYSSRLKVI